MSVVNRVLVALLPLVLSCSSGSSSNGGGGTCPDVSGMWKITAHCDASLVGQSVMVTENACSLTFAAPFNGFTGNVTTDGKITLTGPQSCSGTASPTAIAMTCTPGTCDVTLGR
jgi:hypothetical protein